MKRRDSRADLPGHGKHAMHRLIFPLCLIPGLAVANAPPPGSPTDQAVGPFSRWMKEQELALNGGNRRLGCCSDADGGVVAVQIVTDAQGGHYEVMFRDIEDFVARGERNPPERGKWYPVPMQAVIRGKNPTGFPWAWWAPQYVATQYNSPIRCFIPDNLE